MKLSINGALTIGTEGRRKYRNASRRDRCVVALLIWSLLRRKSKNAPRKTSTIPIPSSKNTPKLNKHSILSSTETSQENDAEAEALAHVHETLTKTQHGGAPDKYFVLNDLPAYYETQKKVEDLYSNKQKWAEYALPQHRRYGLVLRRRLYHQLREQHLGNHSMPSRPLRTHHRPQSVQRTRPVPYPITSTF